MFASFKMKTLLLVLANTLLAHRGGRDRSQSYRRLISLIQLTLALLLFSPLPPSNQVPTEAGQQRDLQQQQQLRSSAHRGRLDQDLHQIITALPLVSGATSSSSSSAIGGAHHPDAPKLIPLSALDRYQEGAELKLFCSASASPSGGKLQLEWRKNHNEPLLAHAGSVANPGVEQAIKQNNNNNNNNNNHLHKLHINMMDESSSVLRITNLDADDSGNYTCVARNQLGFDSSTVRINVNVRLKWLREPPSELQVRAGKSVYLECDASGQPAPLISWTSLKDHQTINSKVLRIDRAQVNDSGLYECRVSNFLQKHLIGGSYQDVRGDTQGNGGEHLRKLVRLVVNDAIGSCCSAVFSLFVLCPFNSNDTKSGIKEIADVNPDDRREMIEFIYTGGRQILA